MNTTTSPANDIRVVTLYGDTDSYNLTSVLIGGHQTYVRKDDLFKYGIDGFSDITDDFSVSELYIEVNNGNHTFEVLVGDESSLEAVSLAFKARTGTTTETKTIEDDWFQTDIWTDIKSSNRQVRITIKPDTDCIVLDALEKVLGLSDLDIALVPRDLILTNYASIWGDVVEELLSARLVAIISCGNNLVNSHPDLVRYMGDYLQNFDTASTNGIYTRKFQYNAVESYEVEDVSILSDKFQSACLLMARIVDNDFISFQRSIQNERKNINVEQTPEIYRRSAMLSEFEYGELTPDERSLLFQTMDVGIISDRYKTLVTLLAAIYDRIAVRQRAIKETLQKEELESNGVMSHFHLTRLLNATDFTDAQIESIARVGDRGVKFPFRWQVGNSFNRAGPTSI